MAETDIILECVVFESEHAKWGRMVILILRSSIVAINLLRNGSREGRTTKQTELSPTKTQRAIQGY